MTIKLVLDLVIGWIKYSSKNIRLLMISFLLTIPISILLNFQFIESSYLGAEFLGANDITSLYRVTVHEEKKSQAIPSYLKEELENNWSIAISYERTIPLAMEYKSKATAINISFFSGGYNKIKLEPELGSLKELEYPVIGSDLIGAVSYNTWVNRFAKNPNVIGTSFKVNEKAIRIAAVLSKKFTSFRRDQTTDIVIPYIHLSSLVKTTPNKITPDTYSYIYSKINDQTSFVKEINTHLYNEVLLLDDSAVVLNKAIGVDAQKYRTITKRVSLLRLIFTVLLIFCFISFITFYIGECAVKQQEFQVRRLCGANELHLAVQRQIDIIMTVSLILILSIFTIPLGQYLVSLMLPQIDLSTMKWLFSELSLLILALFVTVTFLMNLVFIIQQKFIKATVGRGQSASTSQKVQSYLLLSLLLGLSGAAIYSSTLLLKSQYSLNSTNLGFEFENRYIVTFPLPERINQTIEENQTSQLIIQSLSEQKIIDQVAFTSMPPLVDRASFSSWQTPSGEKIGTGVQSYTLSNEITSGYFDALGTKILDGNTVSRNKPLQVVVNKTLWDDYFTGQPLSSAILISTNSVNGEQLPFKIIGVVEDIYREGADTPPKPTVYSPIMAITGFESLIINSSSPKSELFEIIQKTMSSLNVSYKDFTVESITQLVINKRAPRIAILIVTIIASVIIMISSIVFCISTIEQLTEKVFDLVRSELTLFLLAFIPILLLIISLLIPNKHILTNFLLNTQFINVELLIIVSIFLITLITFIIKHKIYNKIKNAWHYLS